MHYENADTQLRLPFLQTRWLIPTASAHVTARGMGKDGKGVSLSEDSGSLACAADDAGPSAAQQAYIPFSAGPRR